MILLQALVAMVATLAFSILFQAPARQYVFCALAGGTGWLVYSLLQREGMSETPATFVATLALVLLCRALSALRKTPVIVFLFAGIFPLVPGAALYFTAYNIFLGDAAAAGSYALQTLKLAGAIVLGILFGYAVPQALFRRLAKER